MLDENGKMVHNIKRNGKHGQNYEAVINVPTQKCAPLEAETSVREREKKEKKSSHSVYISQTSNH